MSGRVNLGKNGELARFEEPRKKDGGVTHLEQKTKELF
jgi:hypothetical protein